MPKLAAGAYPPASGYDADIIILTRNRLAETIAAVDSALRQNDVSCHVSVLDQGSNAGIQAEFTKAFHRHRRFGYFVMDGNRGVGAGRNFLASLGSGRCIVALDNDATFASDVVVAQAVKSFDAAAELGALAFKILARDGASLDEFSWGYSPKLKRRCDEKFATTTFVGAGHAIRRATWMAAGGYDAELFFTWEEYDFCLRAIALNWTIAYDGSLAVIHKISPEARVRWSSERMRLFVRNRLIIARRWNFSWIGLLPRMIGYLVRGARNHCFAPTLGGIAAAIRADRSLVKKPMSLRMQKYIALNETLHRANPYQSFRRHVMLKMQVDP